MTAVNWLPDLLEKIPADATAISAFVGATVGSALTVGLLKSWQEGRIKKRKTLFLAEGLADALEAWARQCSVLIDRNRQLLSSEPRNRYDIAHLFPSAGAFDEREAWENLDPTARQWLRSFYQRLTAAQLRITNPVVAFSSPADLAQEFNGSAAALALEAIDLAIKIRSVYGIKRPAELLATDRTLRDKLTAQKGQTA